MTKQVTALHCNDASRFVEFEGDCAHCEIERLRAEVEGAHHDITSLMDACNAEVNEVERLRRVLNGTAEALREEGLVGSVLFQIEKALGSVHEPSGDGAKV